MHVILTDSNECGCVTMQDKFEGGVNFLQLKRAFVCGGNSRAGRNRNMICARKFVDICNLLVHTV